MTTIKQNLGIVYEKTIEKSFKTILYDNGIVEINWDKSLELIDVKQLIEIKEILYELGNGSKMLLYFSTPDFLQISNEARKYAATEESGKYTLASAVLIDNLAKKIVFDFFMNFNKPKIPTKCFTNKEDAFNWLNEIKKTNNNKLTFLIFQN
jgi:hypothetical protein